MNLNPGERARIARLQRFNRAEFFPYDTAYAVIEVIPTEVLWEEIAHETFDNFAPPVYEIAHEEWFNYPPGMVELAHEIWNEWSPPNLSAGAKFLRNTDNHGDPVELYYEDTSITVTVKCNDGAIPHGSFTAPGNCGYAGTSYNNPWSMTAPATRSLKPFLYWVLPGLATDPDIVSASRVYDDLNLTPSVHINVWAIYDKRVV